MKRPAFLKKSGPFVCVSQLNGYILVKPSWKNKGAVWNLEEGGGPGMFSRMDLATYLQDFLNQGYSAEQLQEAYERIELHDKNLLAWPRPTVGYIRAKRRIFQWMRRNGLGKGVQALRKHLEALEARR